ncbi:MAG TPA: hypothetical protein VJT31_04930 [Rugosimonospora sp.]|nr:hypothetical protein [Rugosimonospora sp.]
MSATLEPEPRAGGKRLNQVRRDCEARLATLDLPEGSTITALCRQIAARRGREIHLIPLAMAATHPCGFWVATEAADFILYEANTSRTHQEHIVAHELAHIICCHRGTSALDDLSARTLFPDVDPQLVRDMLGRATYTDSQEQEAEVMASVILERLKRHVPEAAPAAAEDFVETVARIERALTYRTARRDPNANRSGKQP